MLYAPADYWDLPEKIRDSYGCGPGGFGDLLVPDTVYGLSIKPACCIHDFYYRMVGEDEMDRLRADDIFRINMRTIVELNTKNTFLKWLRLRRVDTYYYMVRKHGRAAYEECRKG